MVCVNIKNGNSYIFFFKAFLSPGAVEAALTGLEIEDVNDPVDVGIVARSFDSCLVCTVHAHDVKSGKELARFKI